MDYASAAARPLNHDWSAATPARWRSSWPRGEDAGRRPRAWCFRARITRPWASVPARAHRRGERSAISPGCRAWYARPRRCRASWAATAGRQTACAWCWPCASTTPARRAGRAARGHRPVEAAERSTQLVTLNPFDNGARELAELKASNGAWRPAVARREAAGCLSKTSRRSMSARAALLAAGRPRARWPPSSARWCCVRRTPA